MEERGEWFEEVDDQDVLELEMEERSSNVKPDLAVSGELSTCLWVLFCSLTNVRDFQRLCRLA